MGALKRVQENRHKVEGEIPFELLECVKIKKSDPVPINGSTRPPSSLFHSITP